LAMPITPVEIMLGKIIPYIIVGFVQAALIIAIGIGLFGVPAWAQWIGEFLPLTHYLRIVRGIMLKGAAIADLRYDTLALAALMLIAMIIAITRFRRTLD
jgi:ABC-2 type transport system permease protein